jgi:hopanoid biosynthesis associated protein HpnK
LSRKVIFNADDFGLNESVNEAVRQAYLHGVLTSASLMVNGEAVAGAVAIAKAHPELSVGLHLVLVSGRAALPPADIPRLVDSRGEFRQNAFAAGMRYFFDARARQELQLEMRAQFDAFLESGLPLTHVDGHLNMHMHPAVFPILITLMQEFGVHGVRIPRDDLNLALAYSRRSAAAKALTNTVFLWLAAWQRRRLTEGDFLAVERTYGLLQSGHMNTDYLLLILERSSYRTIEVYAHPTAGSRVHELGPNPDDLQALLDPRVRSAVPKHGFKQATYAMLSEDPSWS